MNFPIIYKRTSTGAIQQWQQEVNQENKSQYRTISGQVDGKLVTSAWTQCIGTNVGRANERTPEEQVIFEVNANYKKKLDKDYNATKDTIDTAKIFIPMLAKEYGEHKAKLKFHRGIFSQPKLDGARLIVTKDGMFSRNGKPYKSVPHILEQLKPLFDKNPDLIFDGELYNHAYKEDFNKIMSLVKKLKPTAEEIAEAKEKIEYHIYDCPSVNGTFEERYNFLNSLITLQSKYQLPSIEIVDTNKVENPDQLDVLYTNYMEAGYEGQMVRQNATYENKRTDKLLKRKEWVDSEFECVDIEEGLGNWKGYAKRAYFKLPDGRVFKASVAASQSQCKEWLENKTKYIGKPATVVYCPQLTPDGIPRFGRVKEFDRQDNQ